MKTLNQLILATVFSLMSQFCFAQGGGLGNVRPLVAPPLGWTGGFPGDLQIRNDIPGQPINFYTNGFLRMTILDGAAGPLGGFVGINCTPTGVNAPNQLFTVRGGNINAISPIGNTGYMISSAANPSEFVLRHAANRTNILVGVQAAGLTGNTGGFRTTIVGFQAGQNVNFSDDCVFIGYNAGANNLVDFNVFIGSGGSSFNVGASNNVSVGYQAGQTLNSNTPTNNVFVGFQAGQGNTNARFNTMLGFRAGRANFGEENTFVGHQAAMQCTSGTNNVAIGNNTGLELTTGIENVLVGSICAANNATGSQNVILGHDAAQTATSIDQNVIIGEEAYTAPAAIGNANVIVGWRASNLDARWTR